PPTGTPAAASSCVHPVRSARAHTEARSPAGGHALAAARPHRRTRATADAARPPTSQPSQLPSLSSSNDDHIHGHRSRRERRSLQRTNKVLLTTGRTSVNPRMWLV